MQVKAAILIAVQEPLVVDDVELAEPKRGEVLVRLAASGLCHADLHAMTGDRPRPLPAVIGHEGAGVVEAIGEGVARRRVGDHVICSWAPNCGHCFFCDQEQSILCEALTAASPTGVLFDGTPRMSRHGQPVYHFTMVSSHAEYCVVPEGAAVPIPKGYAARPSVFDWLRSHDRSWCGWCNSIFRASSCSTSSSIRAYRSPTSTTALPGRGRRCGSRPRDVPLGKE